MSEGERPLPADDVSTASLTDALGRLTNDRLHVLDLVSPTPGRVLSGWASTIRYVPFRQDVFDPERHTIANLFYEALPADPTRTVLVLDGGVDPSISVGGSTKFSRVQNWGLAGLITSARLRDFELLAQYDPVFYGSGETIKAGSASVMPVASNVAVTLGGVTVYPGDYIRADRAGAVVVPARLVDETFRLASEIDDVEAAAAERIRAERRRPRRDRS